MTPATLLPRVALGLGVLVATLWLALNRERMDPALIEVALRSIGFMAPVAHVLLFALGSVLFVPGALFALAGGALFGPVWGTLLNIAGATSGATAAFLVSRFLAADWVRRKAGERLERIVAGVEAEGWRFVALTRLAPLIPFNLLNYALGLTRIPLRAYVATTLVCMAPGALAYTWLGYAGREALAGNSAAVRYGLIGLSLLAAIAFLPSLIRRLRHDTKRRSIEVEELAARLSEGKAVCVIDVRGPDEFAGPFGHIRQARNLPFPELPMRLNELSSLVERPIVLVCHTDKRSAKAAILLDGAGFHDVAVLRGGMVRWNEQQLPVVNRVPRDH